MNYEKAVLCAVLEDPDSFVELMSRLGDKDFAERRHRSLWKGLKGLADARQRADAVRVVELVDTGQIDIDLEYIEELRGYLPSIGEYSTKEAIGWADQVRERSKKRRLRERLNQVLQGNAESSDKMMAQVMGAVLGEQEGRPQGEFVSLSDRRRELEELVERWISGLLEEKEPTGFKQFDEKIGGGLSKGQLLVIGGRPGSYKTAWAWLVARNIAQRMKETGSGGTVAFASLEMRTGDLFKRAVCAEARVNSIDLELGRLSEREKARVRKASAFLLGLPIRIYDGMATSDFLHYQIMMIMAKEDVKLLIIDFAEMVADSGWNEEGRVSQIFKSAKDIAKLRNIPVIVLSQLNRQVEYEPSRIPGLHHLRWGGVAEAVADMVAFCYFPHMYLARGEAISVPSEFGFQEEKDGDTSVIRRVKDAVNKSKWYLIIAKGRYSGLGHVKFNVVPEHTAIYDYDPATEKDGVIKLTGSDEF